MCVDVMMVESEKILVFIELGMWVYMMRYE